MGQCAAAVDLVRSSRNDGCSAKPCCMCVCACGLVRIGDAADCREIM